MRGDHGNKSKYIFLCITGIILIWISVLIAPLLDKGYTVQQVFDSLPVVISHPFDLKYCNSTVKILIVAVLAVMIFAAAFLSADRNYRRGEEYGSARWGSVTKVLKRIKGKKREENIILSQSLRLGFSDEDLKRHRLNLNVLVDGGSGAGKTLSYVTPNILQGGSSFVILDPKGYNKLRQ